MQLMTVVSVRLKELSKEGEIGRKKITRYTRWLTVPLAMLQAFGYLALFTNPTVTSAGPIIANPTPATEISIILTLTAGTIIAMWLGELITEYGVGNGVSLIIFVGIIGRLPAAIVGYGGTGGTAHIIQIVVMAIIAVAVTAAVIEVQQAQRKIPVQSAQRVLNVRTGQASQGRRNFLPLRVNAAGVIPIIFAISIMTFPTIFANLFQSSGGWTQSVAQWITTNWQATGGNVFLNVVYNAIYFLLVMGFTYFYTAIVFDPVDVVRQPQETVDVHPGHTPGQEHRRVSRQGHGADHARRRPLPGDDHRGAAAAHRRPHRRPLDQPLPRWHGHPHRRRRCPRHHETDRDPAADAPVQGIHQVTARCSP